MITEKDYEVLFYITPKKYRGKLDGDSDPKRIDNFSKEQALGEKLIKCSHNEFVKAIKENLLRPHDAIVRQQGEKGHFIFFFLALHVSNVETVCCVPNSRTDHYY